MRTIFQTISDVQHTKLLVIAAFAVAAIDLPLDAVAAKLLATYAVAAIDLPLVQ